jgi:hypothetical protein
MYYLVIGSTKPHKEALKALGARFNPTLSIDNVKTAGWILSKTSLAEAQSFIANVKGFDCTSSTPETD